MNGAGQGAGQGPPGGSATAPAGSLQKLRQQLLSRFERWLDRVLADEEPPAGVDAELLARLEPGDDAAAPQQAPQGCDLYSLWAALTVLSQEVKLQGRTFKQLTETLSGPAAAGPRAPDPRAAEERAWQEVLGFLLDLRDRLVRGLAATRPGPQRAQVRSLPVRLLRLWLGQQRDRPAAGPAAGALREGYQMTLDRLDDRLRQLNVRQIPCRGRPLDPRLMTVVDVQQTYRVAEGTVVEVNREGFERDGQIIRPAEVTVARRPHAAPAIDAPDPGAEQREDPL